MARMILIYYYDNDDLDEHDDIDNIEIIIIRILKIIIRRKRKIKDNNKESNNGFLKIIDIKNLIIILF